MDDQLKKSFFKSKKFIYLASVFFLLFLFAPFSVQQVGSRVARYIDGKAVEGAKNFQNQVGLKIEWQKIKFSLLTMTVKITDAKISPLRKVYKDMDELNFLSGQQRVKEISARVSLYSLLIERKIFINTLKIESGDIHLKSQDSFSRSASDRKEALPIRKIIISQGRLSFYHNKHFLVFNDIKIELTQKAKSEFDFSLFVRNFLIKEDQGIKNLMTTRVFEEKTIGSLDQSSRYQLFLNGFVKKDHVFFDGIKLWNKDFSSRTSNFHLYTDSKGVKKASLSSTGSLPFFFIKKGLEILDKKPPSIPDSLFSYDLDVEFKRNEGYFGEASVKAKNLSLKPYQVKSLFFKTKLQGKTLTLEEGRVESRNQGSFDIKKAFLDMSLRPFRFQFQILTKKLNSEFPLLTFFKMKGFPVKGHLSSEINCEGDFNLNVKCEGEGGLENLDILANKDPILSLRSLGVQFSTDWRKGIYLFDVKAFKETEYDISFKGSYKQAFNQFEANYSFYGEIGKHARFYLPFPLTGKAYVERGSLLVRDGKTTFQGSLTSPLISLDSYQLRNVSGLVHFQGSELKFSRMKFKPNKSSFFGNGKLDFSQSSLIVNLKSNFSDIQDINNVFEKKFKMPFDLKGTGSFSLSVYYPWKNPQDKRFDLNSEFFNVFVNKDFFQQAKIKMELKDNEGLLHSLFFQKGLGTIQGSGKFTSSYDLDLDLEAKKLSLEELEVLNDFLSLNQVGDMSFSMKLKGPILSPEAFAKVSLSNNYLYLYPVKDSEISMRINSKQAFLSGNIMEEIEIKKFVYPFSGQGKIEMEGEFKDFDFVKTLLARNREQKGGEYFSKVQGSFDLSKEKKQDSGWTGQAKVKNLHVVNGGDFIKSDNPFSLNFSPRVWSLSSTSFSTTGDKKLTITENKDSTLQVLGHVPLSTLSVFFPVFQNFQVLAEGRFLIDNNLKRPRPRGSLSFDKAFFSLPPLPEFEDVKGSIDLKRDRFLINDFKARAGGSEVKGSGSVFYNFQDPLRLNLNLNFKEAFLNIPEGFHTKGSGELRLTGSKPPYLISGRYLVDSGAITKSISYDGVKKHDFSFLKTDSKKKDSLFHLDLSVKTLSPLEVKTNLIKSTVEGEATLFGPLDEALMNGSFSLSKNEEESLVFFRGQEFKINTGSLIYKNSKTNNPHIKLNASAEIKEELIDPSEGSEQQEKTYLVYLSFLGQADRIKFYLTSQPVLSEQEILSLITLGVGSRRFDSRSSENVTDYSYQILVSLMLEKPLSKEIKEALGLDFHLTPYINTSNEPKTKVTLSRDWFKKWKTSFSRSIEENAQNEVQLKYLLSNQTSLTAFWENENDIEHEEETELRDRFGLDFEFNFDF